MVFSWVNIKLDEDFQNHYPSEGEKKRKEKKKQKTSHCLRPDQGNVKCFDEVIAIPVYFMPVQEF